MDAAHPAAGRGRVRIMIQLRGKLEVAVMVGALAGLLAAPVHGETLNEAVLRGLGQRPEVRAAEARVGEAMMEVEMARNGRLPTLSASAGPAAAGLGYDLALTQRGSRSRCRRGPVPSAACRPGRGSCGTGRCRPVLAEIRRPEGAAGSSRRSALSRRSDSRGDGRESRPRRSGQASASRRSPTGRQREQRRSRLGSRMRTWELWNWGQTACAPRRPFSTAQVLRVDTVARGSLTSLTVR